MQILKNISGVFFLVVLIVSLYFVYLIFKPFLGVIFIAAAIAVTFYKPYEWFVKKFNNRKSLASIVMCILITLLIIIPIILFLYSLSKTSIEAYSSIANKDIPKTVNQWLSNTFVELNITSSDVSDYLTSIASSFNSFIVSKVGAFLKGTTQLIVNIILIMLTMFFFFRDGKTLLKYIMRLTPLMDKYDKEIFNKFREVSYSALFSTLITGIAQGFVGAIGYAIVGLPYLFLGTATAFASLIPFVGVGLVWVPVAIYLAILGQWWQVIFISLWGLLIISLVDNLMRPLLMKGKTQIHPMILFFAIFGGISLFGFWGIIFGPLIIAIALTLLHIYDVEYCAILDGNYRHSHKEKKSKKT